MTVTILHDKCKNPVMQDLKEHMHLLVTFGLGKKSTNIAMGELLFTSSGTKNAVYFCTSCEKYVEIENLLGTCYDCGDKFSVKNLNRLVASNGDAITGTYCNECAKNIPHKNLESLDDVLKRVYISKKYL